ncbi:restriction endonuclease [Streptomyces sp. NPDC014940]|uniref:restriction endonuclease n=1 Tax=Streptomyces sp. NPDC014940 TaxID=3364932 RepID=UPI0037006815
MYERLVYAELLRIFQGFSVREQSSDYGSDFTVATADHRAISIETKALQSPVATRVVHQFTGMATARATGGLLVSNQKLTRAAEGALRQAQQNGNKVSFVRWRDEGDSAALENAVHNLLREVGPGSSNEH